MPFSPESIAARAARRAASPRPATPATPVAFTTRPRRPGPAPAKGARAAVAAPTRDLVFAAAAAAFSRDGFDGVGVDDIARAAGVNKAMIYYHFKDKLTLYRDVVRDMLRAVGAAVAVVADSSDTPARKIERFIETLAAMRDDRPWFPPLMMREMAAGAPHLDTATLTHMRGVFTGFAAILESGVAAGAFRKVNPVMAYMSILGPLMMNAARERAAAAPGRAHLPIFAAVDRRELIAHMQHVALSMLRKDDAR
jgi:TetR/AcrR family transcriptional regulator